MDNSCVKELEMWQTHEGWIGGHEALVTKMKRTVFSLKKPAKTHSDREE